MTIRAMDTFSGMDTFTNEQDVLNAARRKGEQAKDAKQPGAKGERSQPVDADDADDGGDGDDGDGEQPSGALTLTQDQLQQVIEAAVDQSLSALKDELNQTKAELKQVKDNRDSLEGVFKTLGKSAPNINTRVAMGRDRLDGLAADFVKSLDTAPKRTWVNPSTGDRHVQRDMSRAKRLFHTQRDGLRQEMEAYAQRHGLLQGGGFASDAPTARGDVPPAFLDYLSLVMRETHSARYVYWQFPFSKLELGEGPGDTIQVARFRWLPEAVNPNDRILDANLLSNDSQNIAANAVSIALRECGLGRDPFPPVAVPEFLTAYSILDLENAVVSRLGHDYEAWEDLSIRSIYFSTTRVVYNNSSQVTEVPGDVVAGSDGTVTESFINNLYAYLSGNLIPALDDGKYVLVLHDRGLAQFKNSLADKFRYVSTEEVERLTNLLQSATNRIQGKTAAYEGTYCGFHIFSTNAHSMGVAGTEGVNVEALGVGPTLVRSSLAFGRAAVARTYGMEPELRRDNNDNFGRMNRWVWLSHEGLGALDVDPALDPDQQLRVVEVRTVDVEV